MTFSSKELGKAGEIIARNYLQKKGYQILAENYTPKWASFDKVEADIVAKKDDVVVFVEVKTISVNGNSNFLPEDKINFLKQKKIKKVAESFLLEKKIPLNIKWQIDTISVMINPVLKKAKIRQFKNVIAQ